MRAVGLWRVAAALAAAWPASPGAGEESAPDTTRQNAVTIVLEDAPGGRHAFEVRGLTTDEVAKLEAADDSAGGLTDIFEVSVAGAEGRPMLGRSRMTAGGLRFEPRFPLDPGRTYVAVFRSDRPSAGGGRTVSQEFRLPERPVQSPTSVVEVYPTAGVLPENLLKFYLHFSAPMSRGDSYRHLRLLDEEGAAVDLPFLELGEELWNDDGTRLTLFFDPGRIKRGVKPREDQGTALREGGAYELLVDAAWLDADGRPLEESFRRRFEVGPPDDRQPDPRRWDIESPAEGTREPLVVRFGEPLDRAMLGRVLSVSGDIGATIRGEIEIDRGETRWCFRPAEPWAGGGYRLTAETTLEDLAGNSIGRPFEVELSRASATNAGEAVAIRFVIGGEGARGANR